MITRRALIKTMLLPFLMGLTGRLSADPGEDRLLGTIQVVGEAYLSEFPHELDLVRRQRFENIGMINKNIADDFANDRLVMLRGWVLSITEVRVCAFGYLWLN